MSANGNTAIATTSGVAAPSARSVRGRWRGCLDLHGRYRRHEAITATMPCLDEVRLLGVVLERPAQLDEHGHHGCGLAREANLLPAGPEAPCLRVKPKPFESHLARHRLSSRARVHATAWRPGPRTKLTEFSSDAQDSGRGAS